MAPSTDSIDSASWYSSYRERVAFRLRELVGTAPGGVQDLWRYHMGWTDQHGRPVEAEMGKMLRPVLCLTVCAGYHDNPAALDAAAAIELLHAFSLVHDDIEDADRQRRHRETLWSQFGLPLALNAGDGLFAKASETLYQAIAVLDKQPGLLALQLYSNACLRMIEGQHLDIGFESKPSVSVAGYLRMVRGKTGAIIGAAMALGALFGGAGQAQIDDLGEAGIEMGTAFQATDDALAFWGNPAETGKAVGNDLVRGKQSLPVVLAAERDLSLERLRGLTLSEALRTLERAGVHQACEAFAGEHAYTARRLIAGAGVSAQGLQRFSALIDFSIIRER